MNSRRVEGKLKGENDVPKKKDTKWKKVTIESHLAEPTNEAKPAWTVVDEKPKPITIELSLSLDEARSVICALWATSGALSQDSWPKAYHEIAGNYQILARKIDALREKAQNVPKVYKAICNLTYAK